MIIDAHCHAWRRWPYRPEVPDPAGRGVVEQLLFEMDRCGVGRALVVCARIDRNPDNNDYVAECVRRFPDRLVQFADVDCSWTATYHTPGAAERLEHAVDRYRLRGVTHYIAADDDGAWFLSDDGLRFFAAAAARRQVVSLAIPPRLQPLLRRLAARFPSVPFLCHHMAGASATEPAPRPLWREILRSADCPNVYVKLSGFHYVSATPWDYPYRDCAEVVRGLYEQYGPDRLCWGSDYPVVRDAMTYRQALEAVRSHCDFIPAAHRERVLGGNLERLLGEGA